MWLVTGCRFLTLGARIIGSVSSTDPVARRGGAVVALEHVTKTYARADAPAVNDLSLTVPAGEICVLVGPSGCGKTTTMKMINRLIEPTSGRITIDGHDVLAMPAVELRRQIGYVIQQVGLFPHLTIGDNVAVVPRLLRWPAARSPGPRRRAAGAGRPRPAADRGRYPPSCRAASASGSAWLARWPRIRR